VWSETENKVGYGYIVEATYRQSTGLKSRKSHSAMGESEFSWILEAKKPP
jgi:hypothetical protein